MADKKRFTVLGLGSFGTALARRLSENGCRVTGVDQRKDRVEALKDVLYEAVIADATERESMEQISLKTADAAFISLGEDITRSLLAALHAKELGARRIIVKGVTEEHGKLLTHLGVERVVFPEVEIARELADRMTWPNVVDYLPIDPEYSFVEFSIPSAIVGETLREADLRRRYGVWVVGVKDVLSGKLQIFPDADFRFGEDQLLLVVGKQADLDHLRELQ
jgi:trk system potassium uptake protein TrkA